MAYYEQVADAPDAVARLRRFVLDLAVRGKLVPQHPNERPLKSSDKPLGVLPFDLPDNWCWFRVGDQLDLLNGMAFKPSDWNKSGLRIVRIQNLNNHDAPFNFCDPGKARERSLIDDGSFLISWSGTPGTSFGAFIWNRGPAVLNQHIFRCDFKTDAFISSFLRIAINGRLDAMIAKAHGGVGLQHITKGRLEDVLISLPPLAEQHRIVAKVDELMGLCDRLEAARANREAMRDQLAAASLARLTAPETVTPRLSASASNPPPNVAARSTTPAATSSPTREAEDAFADHARFVLDALPALTARPDQIKALRQTIVNLAVRGKLVPQDANDEPASELLKQLKKARIALEAKGKTRKDKGESPPHYGGEHGFDLPSSWSWARLTEIGQTKTGTSPNSANPDLFGKFIPFIKPADLDGNHINYDGPGLSEIGISHSRLAAENSILMVCIGATLGKINTTARPVCFNQQINSLTPYLDGLTAFVAIALKTSDFQSLAWSKASTGTLPIISKGKWEVLSIPLPPLAEQRRIVAKVDSLMSICDQLEASLTTAAAMRRLLLDVLLVEALAPDEDCLVEAAE
nr:restriction endonuclease subunit S [Methylobacterium oryzihabitans]